MMITEAARAITTEVTADTAMTGAVQIIGIREIQKGVIQTTVALATDEETKAETIEVMITEAGTKVTDAETTEIQTAMALLGVNLILEILKEDTAVLVQKDATAKAMEDFPAAMIILMNTNEFSKINRK